MITVSGEWGDYVGSSLETQVKYVYCDGRRIGTITKSGNEQRRYYVADIWNGEEWLYTFPHSFPDFDVCRMAIEESLKT